MGEASRAQAAADGQRDVPVRAAVPSIARHRVDRFVNVLERAVAEPDVSERLCTAGVRVRIDLKDLPGTVITLRLDEPPARVALGSADIRPDVRLWMWSADLEAVLRKRRHLPLQILSGAVEFEGYVRKLLRVLPILTDAAAGVADPES
jgi:hypothetical protein